MRYIRFFDRWPIVPTILLFPFHNMENLRYNISFPFFTFVDMFGKLALQAPNLRPSYARMPKVFHGLEIPLAIVGGDGHGPYGTSPVYHRCGSRPYFNLEHSPFHGCRVPIRGYIFLVGPIG